MRGRSGSSRSRARLAIALGSLAWIATGCGANAPRRAPRMVVAVARVEERDTPYAILASGTVEPRQTATLSSPVGGVLQRVRFREGDEVREGQPLFQIDPRPFESALAQAQGVLARDRAQLSVAQTNVQRAEALIDQKVISSQEYDNSRATAEAARATVHADSAALVAARLNLEYSTVRAPISGRTGKLLVHVGDMVKANAPDSPLLTINELSPILVRFAVPQSELPRVQRYRATRPATWVTHPGVDSTAIEGQLTFVDNTVDAGSGTVLLKSEFPNRDAALWPGAFVNVRLVLFVERHAIRVPSPAVVNAQSGTFVYVVNADSTVTVRPVRMSRTADDWSVISEGLTAGERVVTDGQLRLTPGARVTWKEPAPTASND